MRRCVRYISLMNEEAIARAGLQRLRGKSILYSLNVNNKTEYEAFVSEQHIAAFNFASVKR